MSSIESLKAAPPELGVSKAGAVRFWGAMKFEVLGKLVPWFSVRAGLKPWAGYEPASEEACAKPTSKAWGAAPISSAIWAMDKPSALRALISSTRETDSSGK